MIQCAYCGRTNLDSAGHCLECGSPLSVAAVPDAATTPPEKPPELPAPKVINPEVLAGAFSFENGFHRAKWELVGQWIDSHVVSADALAAWHEAFLLWTTKLRDDLGGNYYVLQSPQAILLCAQPLETGRWILDYAGRAAAMIKETLGRTAWSGAAAKDVLLIFSEEDDYYQYLSFHSRDGEQATSGGVCIHSGCTHIALPWADALSAANTIVHELTHDCLAHLPLPLWLNEGVALSLQRAIAPPPRSVIQGDQNAVYAALINWSPPILWDELAERHFDFWTEENIQSFWAGTSFYQPGDPNELSYSLAEVLVKLLSDRSGPDAWRTFMENARQEDAGQTAALEILGADLGEVTATFLGEGQWRPLRKAMVTCWESAGWQSADSK